MASSRHLARIIALQVIYEYNFHDPALNEKLLDQILQRHLKRRAKNLDGQEFTTSLVKGVVAKAKELDDLIRPTAPQRPLEEIPLVDHSILQISVYELLYKENVPPKVAINEAVELAKQYGGENSSKFVNGVLGTIYRQLNQDGRIASMKESATGAQKSVSDDSLVAKNAVE